MYKIPANTLFMGQSLVFMPECHSTNTELLNLIKAGKGVEGLVTITSNQTAGRGQRSNTWESEPGKNLTFSILLTPAFLLAKDQFNLTVCISVAVADYLAEAVKTEVKIKWPNDVLVHDKKLCGILIENQLNGQTIQSCIVGVGLNVNQENFQIEKAGSMKSVTGKEFNLSDEFEKLLQKIEARYLMLRQGNQKKLLSEYLDRMYRIGEKHLYSAKDAIFEGVITGVDEVGRLRMETPAGERIFETKEVQFLP